MVEYVTDLVQSRTQHGETCHRRSSQRPVMTGGRERIQMVMTRWATRAGDGDGEIQLVVLVHSLRFAVPSPGVAPSYDGSLGQGSKQRENHNDDTGGLKRKAHDLDVANTRAPYRTQRAHTLTKHKFGPCHVYLQTLKRGTASAHYAVRGGAQQHVPRARRSRRRLRRTLARHAERQRSPCFCAASRLPNETRGCVATQAHGVVGNQRPVMTGGRKRRLFCVVDVGVVGTLHRCVEGKEAFRKHSKKETPTPRCVSCGEASS